MAEQQYDNTNAGVIFKHDKKGNDKAPDYKGKVNVDGKDKQIALWVKKSKAGVPFFSVKIDEPYVAAQPAAEAKGISADDNGLPF